MMQAMALELVHPLAIDAVAEWCRPMATAFLRDPHGPEQAARVSALEREWDPDTAWGAREHGRWVATLRTMPRSITVPGEDAATRELAVDALTNVTVAATHRRRGLLRRMLDEALGEARERGDAASVLIAAEWPIYGRFGYAPATLAADYALHSVRGGATAAGDPTRVRQVEREEFLAIAPAVYAAARRGHAGQIDRAGPWWNRTLGGDGYAVPSGLPANWLVSEGDDGPDGLLAWTPKEGFGLLPPFGAVEAWGPFWSTDAAYANLLAYLLGIDVVDRIELRLRPIEEPATWLLADARTLVMTQHVDFLWLRLLDVSAALAARRYATRDELVIEVVDDGAGAHAAGRYRLSAEPGAADCAATRADADVTITARALASISLGGFRLAALPAAVAEEATPGARARLDLMFSTPRAPWNATWF